MTGFPINPPRAQLVDNSGVVTSEWYKFFLNIQKVIGGPSDPFDDSALSTGILASETPGTLTAGSGLTGGGNAASNVTVTVGAGTGITVNADDVALDTTHVRNVDHSAVSVTAGAGLTGGGTIEATRTLDVGAGTGITVNANDVAIDTSAEAERVRDVIAAFAVAGTNMTITHNDGADTLTFDASGGGGGVTLGLVLAMGRGIYT